MTTTITVHPGEVFNTSLTYDTVVRSHDNGDAEWVITADSGFHTWLVNFEWIENDDSPFAYAIAQIHETNGGWFLLSDEYGEHRNWQNVYAVGTTREEAIQNYLNSEHS